MQEQGIRLLLVEDEPGVREAIKLMLSYDRRIKSICETGSLVDTLAVLARGEIDVIVLDLRLPDSDGADTVESIVALYPEIPIVVLTALDLTKCLTDDLIIAGAFAFMSKESLFKISLTDWVSRAYTSKRLTEKAANA